MAPGAIVLYLDPTSSDFQSLNPWLDVIRETLPGVNLVIKLEANDAVDELKNPFRHQYFIHVEDVAAIYDSYIKKLQEQAQSLAKRCQWNLFRRISFDQNPDFDASKSPPSGMHLVQVGMAPRPDHHSIKDYHNWYATEHMPLLSKVPGWQVGTRWEFVRTVGPQIEEVRPFLACHLYDEQNGLGGPEWRKSIESKYTQAIGKSCIEPNHRRTWTVRE